MIRILDITLKDLLEILRDRKAFLFLLLMPIGFTLLFGIAFGGIGGGEGDARLPVGWLDQDGGRLSLELQGMLASSQVIRLEEDAGFSVDDLEKLVANEELAAAVLIPGGYSRAALEGKPEKLLLIADASSASGASVKSEVLAAAGRLMSSVLAAETAGIIVEGASFDSAFEEALAAWQQPPIRITTTSAAFEEDEQGDQAIMSAAHTSPGMMLQFAIASLLVAAQMIVNERKSKSLQRLLTTATSHTHILLGHFLAIFTLIFAQFVLLAAFGQIILKVDYLRLPVATLLVMFAAALCISALGLLIGVLAKTEDQAIIFSLIPMFVFSGLGGAWMPLEYTGKAFQTIGYLSPVAWAMDGFKNITVRGLGLESVIMPALALAGYAAVFFALSVWKFKTAEQF